MRKYIFILIILLLAGCKARQAQIVTPSLKTVERKVSTLIPVYIQGDSATLRAWFECDSLNNVLLKGIDEAKSKNMQSGVNFHDGVLYYNAKTQPDTVHLPSNTIYKEREIPVTVEIEKEVNVLTKWQTIRLWIADIIMALLSVLGGWKLLKWYLNFKKL